MSEDSNPGRSRWTRLREFVRRSSFADNLSGCLVDFCVRLETCAVAFWRLPRCAFVWILCNSEVLAAGAASRRGSSCSWGPRSSQSARTQEWAVAISASVVLLANFALQIYTPSHSYNTSWACTLLLASMRKTNFGTPGRRPCATQNFILPVLDAY